MKFILLVCLAFGVAVADKLDRTYLPPPGSKFSGGSPGDIQAPFQIPKQTYSTARPGIVDANGKLEIELGINRRPGPSQDFQPKDQFPYFQNSYTVPKTTTTYAFTQTTTLAPIDFESTGVNQPSSDFESNGPLSQQIYYQQPGNQPNYNTYQQNQAPTSVPSFVSQQPSFANQYPNAGQPNQSRSYLPARLPGTVNNGQIIPGQNYQNISNLTPNQFQGSYQDGHIVPTSGSNLQPGFVSNQQFQPGHENLQKGQPSTAQPQYQDGQQLVISPGSGQQSYVPNQPQYPGQGFNQIPSTLSPQYQSGQQSPVPTPGAPGPSVNNNYTPSTIAPQYQGSQGYTPSSGINQPGLNTLPPNQQNQYQYPGSQSFINGNQQFPSTSAPQYQGQKNFATIPSSGLNQPGFISPAPGRQNFNQYSGNNGYQQTPSSTAAPQGFETSRIPQFGGDLGAAQGTTSAPGNAASYAGLPNFRLPGTTAQPSYGNNEQQYSTPGSQDITTAAPQRFQTSNIPQYGEDLGAVRGTTSAPGYSVYPGQPNFRLPGTTAQPSYGNNNQQYSTPGHHDIYNTGSSTTPSPVSSVYTNESIFPSSTPGSFPNRNAVLGTGNNFALRPERPQAETDRNAVILNYDNVITPEGYAYSYDTSNGIHADESATTINGTKAQGSYSYTGDDGKVYSVIYSADENGFQPRGDHLPTPPPIPEAIQRVIEQANMERELGITHDGSYDDTKYGHMKYDRPQMRYRAKNKMMPSTNGTVPVRYENRIGVQNKKESDRKGSNKPVDDGKIINEFEYEDNSEDDIAEDSNDESESQYNDKNSKRPQPDRKVSEENKKKSQPKKNTSLMKTRGNHKSERLNNQNSQESDPQSDTEQNEDDGFVGESLTDNDSADNTDDLQESEESDDELTNYRDDPHKRTDFRGKNKYLPQNSKISNRIKQTGNKRPSIRTKVKRPGSGNTLKTSEKVAEKPTIDDNIEDKIPSKNYNLGGNNKSKTSKQPTLVGGLDRNSETLYSEDDSDFNPNEDDTSDDYTNRSMRKKTNRPKTRPSFNERLGVTDKSLISDKPLATDQDSGYEYRRPEKTFNSGVAIIPTMTSVTDKVTRKPSTARPFITPNVYRVDKDENSDDDQQTIQPGQTNVREQYGDVNMDNIPNYSGEAKKDNAQSSRRPIFSQYRPNLVPFGNAQPSLSVNEYQQASTMPDNYQITDKTNKPNNYVFEGYPANSAAQPDRTTFASSTPAPIVSQRYSQNPGQYQTTYRPTEGSNLFDGTVTPESVRLENEQPTGRPNVPFRQNLPSTTYRPNYSFGDRTQNIPKGVTVDAFGRPISRQNEPNFSDRRTTIGPNYSTNQDTRIPSNNDNNMSLPNRPFVPNNDRDIFRPAVGRFGTTSSIQGTTPSYNGVQSTLGPIGEDFSGPKQPQRFDPETGYHYK